MKNILFAIVCFAFISSCGRGSGDSTPPETLPPATQNGANTAGCYVNGTLLLPKNGSQSIGGSPKYGLDLNSIGNDYYIDIKNWENGNHLYLFIKNLTTVGNYPVLQSGGVATPNTQNNTQMLLQCNGNTFISADNAGTVEVTNFSYPLFSGKYSAILYNKTNPSETIQITEGRFDINRQTLNQ